MISLFQVGWLIIQLIVRASRGIASTQLEVITLAYAICMILSSCFLFSKPQNSKTPSYVHAARYPTPEEMIQVTLNGPMILYKRKWYVIQSNTINRPAERSSGLLAFGMSSIAGSILFGAIHLIAWQFPFPTSIEKTLWRVSPVVATFLPLAMLCLGPALIFTSSFFFGDGNKPSSRTIRIIGFTAGAAYANCRVFILVEAFRSLYFLPPEAYVTTWAANVPHVG